MLLQRAFHLTLKPRSQAAAMTLTSMLFYVLDDSRQNIVPAYIHTVLLFFHFIFILPNAEWIKRERAKRREREFYKKKDEYLHVVLFTKTSARGKYGILINLRIVNIISSH